MVNKFQIYCIGLAWFFTLTKVFDENLTIQIDCWTNHLKPRSQ